MIFFLPRRYNLYKRATDPRKPLFSGGKENVRRRKFFSKRIRARAVFLVRFPSKIHNSAALCLLIISDQAPVFHPPSIISPHIAHGGPALNSYTWPGISQIYACTLHSSASLWHRYPRCPPGAPHGPQSRYPRSTCA